MSKRGVHGADQRIGVPEYRGCAYRGCATTIRATVFLLCRSRCTSDREPVKKRVFSLRLQKVHGFPAHRCRSLLPSFPLSLPRSLPRRHQLIQPLSQPLLSMSLGIEEQSRNARKLCMSVSVGGVPARVALVARSATSPPLRCIYCLHPNPHLYDTARLPARPLPASGPGGRRRLPKSF